MSAIPIASGAPVWDGRSMNLWNRGGDTGRLGNTVLLYGTHAYNHGSGEWTHGLATNIRDEHRHVDSALNVPKRDLRIGESLLERKAASHEERDEIVTPKMRDGLRLFSQFPIAIHRYRARSVRISASRAVLTGDGLPASTTSSKGHGFGLALQKASKSDAYSDGRMARLAWT